ncbi:MAG TPA: hypothetical protein VME44_22810 [Streptosporangiaceae bacterium]|nr:hypothetical protein [Streptosporangiaceae bacterium]
MLVYDPPRRVCFSWDISLRWELESDPAKASEIEVVFAPDGPARTRVVLTHRHLDRHGDGWESMRDAVKAGWSLNAFAAAAAAARSAVARWAEGLPPGVPGLVKDVSADADEL